MYHSGAQDLDPTAALTYTTALALAFGAGDIDLDRRLGEGEEGGTKFDLGFGTVDLMSKLLKHTLKVAHGDVFVDDKTLDLMENRGVRRIDLVGTVTRPGQIIFMGGFLFSMVRICVAEVCVRSRRFSAK